MHTARHTPKVLYTAEKISFSDVHPVMSQDVICGGDMEEHVGNRPALQEREAFEFHCALAGGHLDVPLLRAFERARRDALQVLDSPGNTRAQLLDRLLIVLEARRVDSGKARSRILCKIAHDLHLPRQRQHVRRKTRGDQYIGIELPGGGVRDPLLEDGGQIAERVREYVY